jgi:acetolactate synthase-1/2/3 large subunit
VLYCGGGVISGNASAALLEFAEATGIPVTTTIMGCGAFPETHELSLRWLGMHGAAYANWAVSGEFQKREVGGQEVAEMIAPGADLLLAFGVRFDDRVTGKVEKFCERGTIVHIDIDPSEINKNRLASLPIVSDLKYALERLSDMIRKRRIEKKFTAWHQQIAKWKEKAPFRYGVTEEVLRSQHMLDHMAGKTREVILPQEVIEMLYDVSKGDAIITTGVGQHQMWAGQWYKYKFPRQFITSAGLGAMGFGYPAALGAKVACPDRSWPRHTSRRSRPRSSS